MFIWVSLEPFLLFNCPNGIEEPTSAPVGVREGACFEPIQSTFLFVSFIRALLQLHVNI